MPPRLRGAANLSILVGDFHVRDVAMSDLQPARHVRRIRARNRRRAFEGRACRAAQSWASLRIIMIGIQVP